MENVLPKLTDKVICKLETRGEHLQVSLSFLVCTDAARPAIEVEPNARATTWSLDKVSTL